MGYLVLTRRPDESLVLTIDPAADREALLRELEQDGIEVTIAEIRSLTQARVGIRAPDGVSIARAELLSERQR